MSLTRYKKEKMPDISEYLLNHKRHKRIKFDEDEHKYTYFPDLRKSEGVEYKGITSWVSSFSKVPFIPKEVAEKCNKNPNSKYYDLGVDAILQQWTDKRDKGDAIHKCIEDVVNHAVYDETMSFYIDRFFEEIDKYNIKPFVSEMVVYDEDIERATPIDLLGTRNGKITLCDLKTFEDGMEFYPYGGKTFKHPLGKLFDSKFEKVSLQLSIEKKWLKDKYSIKEEQFDEMYVMVLNDNGAELLPVMDYHNNFVEKMYEFES